jgi:hypothetical protein
VIPLLVATAGAGPIPLPELQARLAEVEPLRARRLGTNAPAIPDSAWAEVANGDVATGLVDADGTKARKIWGVGVVDVPIAAFFSAINDDQNKVDYTKLDTVQILDGTLCGADRTVFQRIPVPLLSDRWWVIQQRIHTELQAQTKGRVREMAWRPPPGGVPELPPSVKDLTAGNQHVTFTHGGWFLVDLGEDRTLVEFWSWSDPGGNVPVRLAASMALGGIEDTFATMSDLARAGPACAL